MPKNMVFIILGIIFIASSWLSKNRDRTYFYSPWISYALIGFALHFGWFFLKPIVFNNARGEITYNLWTVLPSVNVFLGLIMIHTLVEHTDRYERWIRVSQVICNLGLALGVYAVLQYFRLDQFFQSTVFLHSNHMAMFFGNPMLAGNFAAIIAPLCLMFRTPKYYLIYALLGVVTYLSNSGASFAVFIFGSLVYLLMIRKWRWFILSALVTAIAAIWKYNIDPAYFSLSGRLVLWKEVLELCKEAPYSGFGLGYFFSRQFVAAGDLTKSLAHVPHNIFIGILHDVGLLGLGVTFGYLISLFWRLLFVEKSMLLICYMIAFFNFILVGNTAFLLDIAPMALLGILYISCLEVHCSEVRKHAS